LVLFLWELYDVKDILFLTALQVKLLEQEGYRLDTLTIDKLKEIFTIYDYAEICKTSAQLLSKYGVLSKIGIDVDLEWYKNLCDVARLDCDGTFNNFQTEQMPQGTVLTATCGNFGAIFIHPTKSEIIDNDVYKFSRLNILGNLTKIMIFKELKFTKLFKTAFSAEG
jgi:hypothetical protein